MATETFRVDSVSRGSRRTRPDGSVRVIEARLGGSMAGRIEYVERGGSLAARADEVLWIGHAGPRADWQAVDRRERRKDAQVGFEITAAVPHTLPLDAKRRIGQRVAEHLSASFDVPVHAALHKGSKEGDARNEHFHFPFPARDVHGQKLALSNKRTSSEIVAQLRGFFQDQVNAELAAAKINDRLDLRSRAARGLSEACVHVPKQEFVRARRGEIYSPTYARNEAILALREAETAHAHTAADLSSARRSAARADRRSRTDRAATATQRAVARGTRCRAVAAFCRAVGGHHAAPARGRGHHASDSQRPEHRVDVREPGEGFQEPRPTHRQMEGHGGHALSDGLYAGNGGPDRPDEIQPGMGSRPSTAEPGEVTAPAEPPRSLVKRALRWIGGADRREAEAQAQVQAQADQAAALAQVQADTDRLARETIERAAADRAQAEAAARATQIASVRVAAESSEPLIHVATATGGTFYIKREDWLTARTTRARDVPLVDWQGAPVQEGQRKTLRLSTIEAATLRPTAILTADVYLAPTHEQDGPSLGM